MNIIDKTDERMKNATVVASVSGGKDSAAMSLWLTENGIEHERVFMDTGWEHDATYEYLAGPLAAKLGPITTLMPPMGMADLCRKKGMFPSRVRRFCTQELKVKPIIKYIGTLQDAGAEVVNTVGIRAGESEARSKMGEWEWQESYDAWVRRPLIAWTEQDVVDIHTRHGLAPNPLYLRGAGVSRVGCWPCIFSRKAEIRNIADTDPARIDIIRELENDVCTAAIARHNKNGKTLESLGYTQPSFFSGRGLASGDGSCVPIDDVVKWARTAHGGRQYELFAPEHEEGCVRWGLCEANR